MVILVLDTSLEILKKIEENGYKAYIVGGFVRDYILGIKSDDVDIATNATPKDLMNIFKDGVLPNEQYGAVTLFVKKYRFEVTTFRKEIKYVNNRKPVEIEYINDLLQDLKRRDFRMNTLCMDKDGNVIDLLGGKEDIQNKVINTVGDSFFKFQQDSLRILRAVRFATILNFKLSEEVKRAIIENKSSLKSLSYQRKRQELDKIFTSSNSSYGVSLLLELGLDSHLELYNLKNIKLNSDILGIWASINVSENYQFNKNEKEIIKDIKKVLKSSIDNYSLYRYGLYVNQVAADIIGIDRTVVTKQYENLPITSRRDINITSNDIIEALNIRPSAKFKEIYDDLENKILCGNLENDKEKIKKYIIDNY